ncbi:MAG: hypothetical protein ACD_38C00085G0001 [uncultured bacterium]|nr:MAG: hypothetical protein ACD_38C00085G0001 [uncultured bacterium]
MKLPIIGSAKIYITTVITMNIANATLKTALAMAKASSLPLFSKCSVKTGMKATDNAPKIII